MIPDPECTKATGQYLKHHWCEWSAARSVLLYVIDRELRSWKVVHVVKGLAVIAHRVFRGKGVGLKKICIQGKRRV